jgi:uncharacterized protein YndB with AHSA1/START domain
MAEQPEQEHAQPDETRDLIITRIIDAPVALVWNAWNEPDYLMQWWGPEGFTCPLAQMDVRVGGTSLVGMASPEYGTHYSTWHYQEIVPLERIAYIHNLADADGQKLDPVALGMPPDFPQDQRHAITFRALDDGHTELTITEYDWPVGQMMDMSRMGMEQCLNKLAAMVATQTNER